MRFITFLSLFFYLFMGIHTLTETHAQVLCIEKDGHVIIEALNAVQNTRVSDTLQCCPLEEYDCPNCKDIYLNSGHPDTTGIVFQTDSRTLGLDSLQISMSSALQPLVLEQTKLKIHLFSAPITPPAPIHIPSTVLLI